MALFNTPRAATLSTTALTLLTAGIAQADVTPADVWADWKSQMSSFGYVITATEQQAGPDLIVSDVEMTVTMPEDEGTVEIRGIEATFRDNGDGSVNVIWPASTVLQTVVTLTDDEAETIEADLNYDTVGLSLTVSGSPDELVYDYSAASLMMALGKLVIDGETTEIGQAKVEVVNLKGSAIQKEGDVALMSRAFDASSINYLIDIQDPEDSEDRAFISGSLTGLSGEGSATIPEDVDFENMREALTNGFGFDSVISFASGNSEYTLSGDGEGISGTTQSNGGTWEFAIDDSRVAYGVSAQDIEATVTVTEFPFPVTTSMGEVGFEMIMPTSPSADPQDFKFGLTLGDLEIADLIWGMFDPAGKLPRDPATIDIGLSGKAKMLQDIFDPKTFEEPSMEDPGEIHALNIDALTVRAAGAELTGEGGATFDNADKSSYDGMPKPVGAVKLALTGGNALLDTLIEMGLVPAEEAMGMRMMMGMFTVNNGNDQLTSEIKFTEEGQIFANGQRLK